MALCLAISLIACRGFSAYDQLVRYKWWYRNGYMSSTGECFDIGAATSKSLREFERRQKDFAKKYEIKQDMDSLSEEDLPEKFDVYCSDDQAAGNGGLMRLSPVPLFFHGIPSKAVEYSGISAKITHGDVRVYDACRFYGALIVAAIRGETKEEMLDENFYHNHQDWFNNRPLHPEIQKIVEGSYKTKKKGYDDGIRGKGFVVLSLEAALWAFWFDGNSFEKGALAAVNLGDDADTTAAIYGQLAGTYYGYKNLPKKWVKQVYAQKFIRCLSEWIVYEGQRWASKTQSTSTNLHSSSQHYSNTSTTATSSKKRHEDEHYSEEEKLKKPQK
jgi:ADP-ribosylglycohydrolase